MCKCVTFAFLVAHVALILYVVGVATNYWSRASVPGTRYHKGLWQICINNECNYGAEHILNTRDVQPIYRAIQILYSAAGASCAFAVFLLYFAMLSKNLNSSVCLSGLISMVLGASGIVGATAVILFGSYMDQDKSYPEGSTVELYWSFYVAIASVAVVFVAMLANFRYNCTLRAQHNQHGYEKI